MSFRRQPQRSAVRTLADLIAPKPANRQTRRRVVDPHAKSVARRELRQPWSLDPYDLNEVAEKAHVDAVVLFPFVRSLALAHGNRFAVEEHESCGCGVSGLHPRILHVQSTKDPQLWNLRVLHELAHALLREHYPEHTHADVWALTLMLAIPRSAFRHADLARHVPGWVVELRRTIARKVSRAA